MEKAILNERKIFSDNRGYFCELYNKEKDDFINVEQTNLSFSQKGVVRGFHFQNDPYRQKKLITVIKGKVQDVLLNLDTGKFESYILTEGNRLYVPKNYAHGFLALEDTYFMYQIEGKYMPTEENGYSWDSYDGWVRVPNSWSEKDKMWKKYLTQN